VSKGYGFSKVWNPGRRFFQCLEKHEGILPDIGKKGADFSNPWKNASLVFDDSFSSFRLGLKAAPWLDTPARFDSMSPLFLRRKLQKSLNEIYRAETKEKPDGEE